MNGQNHLHNMNETTQKFLAELQQRPDVLGVILFGSWARGNNRRDSDVDLVVILTEGYRRAVEYKDGQSFLRKTMQAHRYLKKRPHTTHKGYIGHKKKLLITNYGWMAAFKEWLTM